ncbi:MAG: Hpt domain-containing protein [Pelobacteraceae bacterium]
MPITSPEGNVYTTTRLLLAEDDPVNQMVTKSILTKCEMNCANASFPREENFNRDEFVNRNLGDFGLCRDVARIFFDQGPAYIQEIRTALELQDNEALRRNSHKLKGAAANMALPRLSETAALLEVAAKEKQPEQAGKLISELEQRFDQAAKAVNELLPVTLPLPGDTDSAPQRKTQPLAS